MTSLVQKELLIVRMGDQSPNWQSLWAMPSSHHHCEYGLHEWLPFTHHAETVPTVPSSASGSLCPRWHGMNIAFDGGIQCKSPKDNSNSIAHEP